MSRGHQETNLKYDRRERRAEGGEGGSPERDSKGQLGGTQGPIANGTLLQPWATLTLTRPTGD